MFLIKKNHFPKKKSFQPPVQEIWLANVFSKFETLKKLKFQEKKSYGADHMLLLWYLSSKYGSVMIKLKKSMRSHWHH